MAKENTAPAVTAEESKAVKLFSREFSATEATMGFMVAGGIYNAAYMASTGMDPAQVGSFMSIHSLIAMFAPMFWGMMSDKYRSIKKMTLITTILSVILLAPVPLYSKISLGGITLAPIMILLSACVSGAAGQLLTSWVMQARRDHPTINFGSIRLFWSFFYAMACFTYATLMKRVAPSVMYTIPYSGYGIAGLVTVLCVLKTHDFNPGGTKKQSFKEMNFGAILKNPRIFVYIVFSIFITLPTLGLNNYMQYLIEDVNGNKAILGYMVGIRSLCAVPFMFFSNSILKKISTRNCLRIAAVIYGIAQLFFFLSQSTAQILTVCIFQGLAFGLLIPTQVLYINQYAPTGLIATTQTMVTVANSLSMSIFSTIGGYVIKGLGIRAFYLMSSASCVVALIIFTFGNAWLDKVRGKD